MVKLVIDENGDMSQVLLTRVGIRTTPVPPPNVDCYLVMVKLVMDGNGDTKPGLLTRDGIQTK